MDKARLEQVYHKVTVAIEKSVLQQLYPWRDWHTGKAPLGADTTLRDCSLWMSKAEQRQEEYTAMLNPMVWSIGTRGGGCNGYIFKLF